MICRGTSKTKNICMGEGKPMVFDNGTSEPSTRRRKLDGLCVGMVEGEDMDEVNTMPDRQSADY